MEGGITGPAIVLGQPDESLLIRAIRRQGEVEMPPDAKLDDRHIEIMTKWVRAGAPWPANIAETFQRSGGIADDNFWSFQSITDPAPPKVQDKSWCQTNVDRFILAPLEQRGLAPAARASKWTLIRRATLDLIGLPPTSAEVAAFLSDETPWAFEKVVDRLLTSPAYGQRWGRHWLDVVRYADARDLIQLPVGK